METSGISQNTQRSGDRGEYVTGVDNKNFDLIAVSFFLMDAAPKYERYVRDARESGDEELAGFLENLLSDCKKHIQTSQQLLTKRMSGGQMGSQQNPQLSDDSRTPGMH